MKPATVLIFFGLTVSAQAEWRIQSVNDRMTNKLFKYATLDAKASDSSIPATLELSCRNGQRDFAIAIPLRLFQGDFSTAYRIDEGEVRPRILYVSSDPNRVHFLDPLFNLIGKKRFRITLMPSGGRRYFYDFDLSGIEQASKTIRC